MPRSSISSRSSLASSSDSSRLRNRSSNSDRFTQPCSSPRDNRAFTSGRATSTDPIELSGRGECFTGGGEAIQRAPEQPRDVHLRYAYPLSDLGLCHVLLEAQLQDHALALRQRVERAAKRLADLDQLVTGLVRGDRIAPAPA